MYDDIPKNLQTTIKETKIISEFTKPGCRI